MSNFNISIVENNSSTVEVDMFLGDKTKNLSPSGVPQVNYDHQNTTNNSSLVHNSTDSILKNVNTSIDSDQDYSLVTGIVWLVAVLMCMCAKPNVPDASYRRFPNGVPVVKKKKEIIPEDRKKLIESKMTTKEVTGQSESGEIILNDHQTTKNTTNNEDGTRIIVETYCAEENNLFANDDDNNYNNNKHVGLEDAKGRTDNQNSVCSSHFSVDSDDENGIMCMICLEPFRKGELVSWSTEMKCRHIFHKDCIHPWLMKNEDCPSCRGPLLPENFEDSPDPQQDEQSLRPANIASSSKDEEDYNGPYIIDFNGLIFRASERFRHSFVESVRRMSIVSNDESITSSSSCNNSSTNEQQKSPPEFIDIEQQNRIVTSPDSKSFSSVNQKTQSLTNGKMPSDFFRKGKELLQNKFMKQSDGKRRLNNLRYTSIISNSSSGESSPQNS